MVICVIFTIYQEIRYYQINRMIRENNYDQLLAFSNHWLFRIKRLGNQIIYYNIAFLASKHQDEETFNKYITKIKHRRLIFLRHYLIVLNHIRRQDLKKAKIAYKAFSQTLEDLKVNEPYTTFKRYLFANILYLEKDYLTALSIIETLQPVRTRLVNFSQERIDELKTKIKQAVNSEEKIDRTLKSYK